MAQPRNMIDGIEIVDYRKLQVKRTLGRGAFGIVYIAEYLDRRIQGPVVMKKIYEPVDELARKLFMKEARLLNGLHHDNIVKMYGICVRPLVIIMEYVCFDFKPFLNKNLKINTVEKFLTEVSKLPKSEKQLDSFIPSIATDITRGLSYLHNLEIAHRDLKPMNILISNQHYCDLDDSQDIKHRLISEKPVICKLADFGESRSQLIQTNNRNNPSTNLVQRGTYPFMAPEILLPETILQGAKLSLEDLKRVDIWALGQVFYCLINPGVSYPFERDGVDVPQMMLMLRQRKRPSADPKYQPKQTTVWSRVHAAFEACTNHKPSERPNATGVLAVLGSHRLGNRHVIGTSPPEQKPPERSHLLGRPSHSPTVQWYASEHGEAALKYLFDELSQIASSEVKMSRCTVTQDISLSFTYHGQGWTANFPFDFPRSKATLICNGKERRKIGGNTLESAVRGIISVLVSSPLAPCQGKPDHKPDVQWYSGDHGQEGLRHVFNELSRIADGEVKMSRKTDTQDITLQFERNRQTWQVQFPANFPRSKANLTRDGHQHGKIGGEDVGAAVEALVTHILSVKEPAAGAVSPGAHEGVTQWYAGDQGEAALKHVYNRLKEIADGAEVEMSRNTDNQDVDMRLEYHGQRWQVIYPYNFPGSPATLHRNREEYGKVGGNSVETAASAIVNHISGHRHAETIDEVDMSGMPACAHAQWYAGDQGEASLRYVYEELGLIADDDVRMSRSTDTQDVTLKFNRHGQEWTVKFPSVFPSSNAHLIFNGDVYAQIGGSTVETAVAAIKNRILSVDQPGAKTLHWKQASCIAS